MRKKQSEKEQLLIAAALAALSKNTNYLRESDEIMNGLNDPIDTDEEDEWWTKQ